MPALISAASLSTACRGAQDPTTTEQVPLGPGAAGLAAAQASHVGVGGTMPGSTHAMTPKSEALHGAVLHGAALPNALPDVQPINVLPTNVLLQQQQLLQQQWLQQLIQQQVHAHPL